MLASLSIHQFALVEHLELDFRSGMTVITGETGAGKSILLDALGLTLGQRADAGYVRHGADKADVSATFTPTAAAQSWLQEHDLPHDGELILRRVVSAEGRSRGYINGRPASAGDLKALARHLISVHSQHAHQQLLEKDAPRQILDAYAGLESEAEEVRDAFLQWQRMNKRLTTLRDTNSELLAQRQLLEYQVNELRELELQEDELTELETEHKRLSNAEHTLLSGQTALLACHGGDQGEDAASQFLNRALTQLDAIDDDHPLLVEVRELLAQASIQVDEAASSLQRYLDNTDMNPHRLQQLDSRLSDLHRMARKHHLRTDQLYPHWQEQEATLAELSLSDDDLEQLIADTDAQWHTFMALADTLSNKRQAAASRLDDAVSGHFGALSLGSARFITQTQRLPEHQATAHGCDAIQFEVQTNPGMPAGPLAKVASGGELARISLALQVVIAATSATPSLIFDEVDVGIGGGTAERVGRLMRQLGEHAQIMCVTHQPQVASQAHNHYQVSKISGDQETHTRIRALSEEQRREEIARMLGGVEITQSTLAHADEMLALANEPIASDA